MAWPSLGIHNSNFLQLCRHWFTAVAASAATSEAAEQLWTLIMCLLALTDLYPLSQTWSVLFKTRVSQSDATLLITERNARKRDWPGLMVWHTEQNIHKLNSGFVSSLPLRVCSFFFWCFPTWSKKVKLRFTSWLCIAFAKKDSVQSLSWKWIYREKKEEEKDFAVN